MTALIVSILMVFAPSDIDKKVYKDPMLAWPSAPQSETTEETADDSDNDEDE